MKKLKINYTNNPDIETQNIIDAYWKYDGSKFVHNLTEICDIFSKTFSEILFIVHEYSFMEIMDLKCIDCFCSMTVIAKYKKHVQSAKNLYKYCKTCEDSREIKLVEEKKEEDLVWQNRQIEIEKEISSFWLSQNDAINNDQDLLEKSKISNSFGCQMNFNVTPVSSSSPDYLKIFTVEEDILIEAGTKFIASLWVNSENQINFKLMPLEEITQKFKLKQHYKKI